MDDSPNRTVDENEVGKIVKQPTKEYPAGCLRSMILFPVGIVLSVLLGMASGQSLGVLWGIIIGIVAFLINIAIVVFVLNKSKTLTIVDCALPFVISILAAFTFAPLALFEGSFFSIGTCIFSGVFLSVGLILYKQNRIRGIYLILPMLTFIYEILPIDLPTDLDNEIALGANTLDLVVGILVNPIKRLKK